MTTPHEPAPAPPDDEPWPSDTVLPASAPGRRAKPDNGSPMGKALLVVGVALVCSLALFGALMTLGDDDGAPAAERTTARPTVPTLSESPAASPSPSQTTRASASPTPSASPSRTGSPTPKPTATAVFATDRSVPVTVLNGTSTPGLAAKAAAALRAKGWTVVSVGNWRGGGVDSTTVFVAGNRDAAATMRRDLPAADLTTRPIGLMKRDRITVVVMGDYKP